MMTKRIFDIILATIGLIAFASLFILISILVGLDSKGGIFYRQIRVGRNMQDFYLYKFRSMYVHDEDQNLLTIGGKDSRITKIGYLLRKYKLDELPQLLNILRGDMSFVGPRPEVRKYVNLYDNDQMQVLSVKPGITDWASIEFYDENELLEQVEDPESFYIHQLIPQKISQNLRYIRDHNILTDVKILWLTLKRLIAY
ncbi:sugar transferase [Pedobacter heparinus]|uniref:sugar transferase n=1 Tax=Pedobacter heparinus TaxID=984 RepID=UPI00292DBDDD|nr:sugar transferase [Pedobacter heparinus]